jgi:hypothetical protein
MLNTPDVLGPSDAEHTQIQAEWSTFHRVQSTLQAEGFTPLHQPAFSCPGYLEHHVLTSHDSRVLAIEYGKYKAWRDYVAERLMYSKQILLEVGKQMHKIENHYKAALQRQGKKSPKKEEYVELAEADAQYQNCEKLQQEHRQLELAYETKLSEYASAMQVISRSITIRGQDIQQGIRQGNLGVVHPNQFG